MTDVVILGAGGAGRETCWALQEDGGKKWNVLGFVDDDPALANSDVAGVPVLGNFPWLQSKAPGRFRLICAVGNPQVRLRLVRRALELGFEFCQAVHASVSRSRSVEIGAGSLIAAGVVLTTNVKIGSHVIVNVGSTVSHDSVIGSYSNINPGCRIAGGVRIGEGVDLGAGAIVIQNRSLGEWSAIGAGAVVTSDVPAHVTAVGVPCRVIKHHQDNLFVALGK